VIAEAALVVLRHSITTIPMGTLATPRFAPMAVIMIPRVVPTVATLEEPAAPMAPAVVTHIVISRLVRR
jgi:hypothetical protein